VQLIETLNTFPFPQYVTKLEKKKQMEKNGEGKRREKTKKKVHHSFLVLLSYCNNFSFDLVQLVVK